MYPVQVAEQPDAKHATSSLALAAYRQILLSMFLANGACIALLAGCMAWIAIYNYGRDNSDRLDFPFQIVLLLVGALGAFFSALLRLHSLDKLPAALIQPELKGLGNLYLTVYSLVTPVTGMIGALVLYYAMASGLLGGQLFPEFACIAQKGVTCGSFFPDIFYLAPTSSAGYAKCIVWSFISGFSERLVPDALGRIEKS